MRPHGLYSSWNSPGHNTGVGNLSLLRGIFPNQGLNPGLPHCRRILYQLSHQGSPRQGLISTTALPQEDYINRTTWHIILRDFFFTQPNFSTFLPPFLPSFISSAVLGLHCCAGFPLAAAGRSSSLVVGPRLLAAFLLLSMSSSTQAQPSGPRGLRAPRHAGASQTRDRICVSALAGGFFTTEPPGKPFTFQLTSRVFPYPSKCTAINVIPFTGRHRP